MSATMTRMPKTPKKNDRHKPRRMVGVPERVCTALEEEGQTREASLAEMVKVACIFFLESKGRWPPPPPGKAPR